MRWLLVVVLLGVLLGVGMKRLSDSEAPVEAESTTPAQHKQPERRSPRTSVVEATPEMTAQEEPLPPLKHDPTKMADVGDPLISAKIQREVIFEGRVDAMLRRSIDRASRRQVSIDEAWLTRQRQQALERLIDDALLKQHLLSLKLTFSAEELRSALDHEVSTRYGTRENFDRFLAARHQTEEEALKRLREGLALEAALAKVGRLEPTEEEVRATYQRSQNTLRAPARARLDMALIELAPRASSSEVTRAQKEVSTLRVQLLSAKGMKGLGAEWAARVRYLDRVIPHGQLPTNLAREVSMAPEGSLVGPVRTSLGLHLVWVHQQHERGILSFEEAQDDVRELARRELAAARRRRLLKTLRGAVRIERLDGMWHRRLGRHVRYVREGTP